MAPPSSFILFLGECSLLENCYFSIFQLKRLFSSVFNKQKANKVVVFLTVNLVLADSVVEMLDHFLITTKIDYTLFQSAFLLENSKNHFFYLVSIYSFCGFGFLLKVWREVSFSW